MDNISNPFGYTSAAARPTWETARPQPPPRRRANSLQHVSTPIASSSVRPTRRSLFNTTVVCIYAPFSSVCLLFVCVSVSVCLFFKGIFMRYYIPLNLLWM